MDYEKKKFAEDEFYAKLEERLTTPGITFETKGKTSKRFAIDLIAPLRKGFEKTFDFPMDELIFSEVCNGTGAEIAKMDSIRSSSLLSFLVFYSAMQKNGLEIPGLPGIRFTDVYFEFLNPTFARSPKRNSEMVSNMDCVLMSADRKDVLFIESKFKEYVTDCGTKDKLSDKYLTDEFTVGIGAAYKDVVRSPGIHYLDGLKQLVTHYSGLKNFERNVFSNLIPESDRRYDIINAKLDGATFHFMEIVYDFSTMGYNAELTDYRDVSRKVENAMTFGSPNGTLPLITYQELLNYKDNKAQIAPKVIDFYKF